MSESGVINCVNQLENTLQSTLKQSQQISHDDASLEVNFKDNNCSPIKVKEKSANGFLHTATLKNGSGDCNKSSISLKDCDKTVKSQGSVIEGNHMQSGEETKGIPMKSDADDSLKRCHSNTLSNETSTSKTFPTSPDSGKCTSVDFGILPASDQLIPRSDEDLLKDKEGQHDVDVTVGEESENQLCPPEFISENAEPEKTVQKPDTDSGKKPADLHQTSHMLQDGIECSEYISSSNRDQMDVATRDSENSEKDTEQESQPDINSKLSPRPDEQDQLENKGEQIENISLSPQVDESLTISNAVSPKTAIGEISITDVKSQVSDGDVSMETNEGIDEIDCNINCGIASQNEAKDESVLLQNESHVGGGVKGLSQTETTMELETVNKSTSVEPLEAKDQNISQNVLEQKNELKIEKRDEETMADYSVVTTDCKDILKKEPMAELKSDKRVEEATADVKTAYEDVLKQQSEPESEKAGKEASIERKAFEDVLKQKNELISTTHKEAAEDVKSGQEKMEIELNENPNSEDTTMSSTCDRNEEIDVKPMEGTEEQENHGLDLLQISHVQSCSDLDNDTEIIMTEDDAKGPTSNAEIKKANDEESNESEGANKDTDDKIKTPPLEVEGSDETTTTATTTTKSNENQIDRKKDESNERKSPDVKLSFKDILKKDSNQVIVKNNTPNEKTHSDSEDAIIIDETETLPETPKEEEEEPKDVLGSGSSSSETAIETNNVSNEESSSNDGIQTKKRTLNSSVENSESESSSTKRQRLDSVVNKLGEHVGVKPSDAATTIIMDSDEDDTSSSEIPEKAVPSNVMKNDKLAVTLSSQMLKSLIKASLRSFVKNQKLDKEMQINERMKKMENATELWRETAKHLEKSVNELTTYTKELQKRKNQSSKLKHLSNRTVAVQVSLERSSPNVQVSIERSPNENNMSKTSSQSYNRSTSLSLPPSVLRHPVPSQSTLSTNRPMSQAQANGNMRPSYPATSPNQRQQFHPAGPRGSTPMATGVQQKWRKSGTHLSSPLPHSTISAQQNHTMKTAASSSNTQQPGRADSKPANPPMTHASNSLQGSASNMIDLTAEDDSSRQAPSSTPQSSQTSRAPATSGFKGHSQGFTRLTPDYMSSNQTLGPGDRNNVNFARRPASGVVMHVDQQSGGDSRNKGSVNSSPASKSQSVNNVNSNLANGQAVNQAPSASSSSTTGASSHSSRSLPPSVYVAQPSKHPAPLPVETFSKTVNTNKIPPPKPSLKISRVAQGIVLSWNMPVIPVNVANIASYQLFAYQETNSAPSSSLWKKVGDVKALPLPMACTLVQFQEGNKYYFAVRALDVYGRWGEYSDPSSIYLFPK